MQSPPKKRPPRKFFCNFQDCGKSFTRAEHLQRHELNHRDSPNTCARCSAHFARPDLLERHMERHAQKDKQAGGEGLGILVTRKRCWRDEDGNITTKRPASSVAAVGKALEAQRQRRGDSSDEGGSGSGIEGSGSPISPPDCSESPSQKLHEEQVLDNAGFRQAQKRRRYLGVGHQDQNLLSGDFIEDPGPSQQPEYHPDLIPVMPDMPDMTTSTADEVLTSFQTNFDDPFTTDTSQGLTIPFTTLNNYNWLFDELRLPESGTENISIPFNQNMDTNQVNTAVRIEPVYGENQLLPTPVNDDEFHNFGVDHHEQQFVQQEFQLEEQLKQRPAWVSLESHAYFIKVLTSATSSASGDPYRGTANSVSIHRRGSQPPSSQHHNHITAPIDYPRNSLHPSRPHCSKDNCTPEIPASSEHPLPKIDEVTRQQVLELIIQATISTTGEPQFSWDDPLLSLSALQDYLDLFFSRFNMLYPLIHRQSFDPKSVNTLLLVSILMLGTAYGEKDAYQMAVRVNDMLRGVFSGTGLGTVWLL